jgi:hypothetical protein
MITIAPSGTVSPRYLAGRGASHWTPGVQYYATTLVATRLVSDGLRAIPRLAPPSGIAIEEPHMIRHTVVFRLRHDEGSAAEADFLRSAREQLTRIPGVEHFEVLRQTGSQSPYRFSLSMEFVDAAAYSAYNEHSAHQGFVQGRWIPEVEEFLELDFEAYA